MKEFFVSLWALVWAIGVTILMWTFGVAYSLGYSIWLTITLKKWYAFFVFWWRLIDGLFFAIAHILYEIAYGLDLTWNVNGEILEDMFTDEEHTTFTDRDISVSASVGKLEIEDKLNKSGKRFSKVLNFAFGQKQHATDAWYYTKAKKELKEKYFQKK
jgi:hypothetical protein